MKYPGECFDGQLLRHTIFYFLLFVIHNLSTLSCGPGTSTIARLMSVNFFAKTKTNMGNLPLSCWKKIEIFKIVRFQSLIFTSKPKGYLLQTTKLWEKLIVITEERKKAMKPKEEVCSRTFLA